MRRFETEKPTRPAFGFEPRPVAPFVADFAARSGRRARERRDRRRMIVRLDLHQDVDGLVGGLVGAAARSREPAPAVPAFDHRGIVAIRRENPGRICVVGVADHAEQRLRRLLPVDDPVGVEDLVPAVLGVRLGEHHQLHIGRVAAQLLECVHEVLDLVLRQGQAERRVRRLERSTPLREHGHRCVGLRRRMLEQRRGLRRVAEHALRHAVVHQRGKRFPIGGSQGLVAAHVVRDAALDAANCGQPADVGDVGGLARPWRDGSERAARPARSRPAVRQPSRPVRSEAATRGQRPRPSPGRARRRRSAGIGSRCLRSNRCASGRRSRAFRAGNPRARERR